MSRFNRTRQDAKRYRILRDHLAPRNLYYSLVKHRGFSLLWKDLPTGQSIVEKIDELCDAAIAQAESMPQKGLDHGS